MRACKVNLLTAEDFARLDAAALLDNPYVSGTVLGAMLLWVLMMPLCLRRDRTLLAVKYKELHIRCQACVGLECIRVRVGWGKQFMKLRKLCA